LKKRNSLLRYLNLNIKGKPYTIGLARREFSIEWKSPIYSAALKPRFFLPAFFACTLFGPWALASLFGSAFWIALLVALFGSAFGLRFWVD